MGILLEISIYSAVIFVLIMGFKLIFKNKISPNLHYMVWVLLLIRLVMPFTLDTGSLIVISSPEPPAVNTEISSPIIETSPIPQTSDTNTPIVQPQTNVVPEIPERSQSVPQVRPLTTEQILFIVWIFGMVVYGGFIGIQMFRAKKRFASQMPVTEHLQGILDKCREKMGIKRKVKIHCHFGLVSPCLTCAGKILMPAEILAGSTDEEISHMIMHELAHYKRKDHIMLIIMAILRAVYWFNPVVWLAYGKVREDMERACDGVVVKHLEAGEKAHYANTILTMIARPGKQVFALGMADVKATAKKRIEGIFMKQNTKFSVKITAMFVALIIAVACFTTACQPTPEEPIVINRAGDELENKLEATPLPTAKPTVPVEDVQNPPEPVYERWEEQITKDYLTVNIDANIILPEVPAFPVYTVAPRYPTEQDMQKMIDYFMQGEPLYQSPPRLTKEVLEASIIEYKAVLERSRAEGWEEDVEYYENIIEEYTVLYPNAPSEDDRVPVTAIEFAPSDMTEGAMGMSVVGRRNEDGTEKGVAASYNPETYSSGIGYDIFPNVNNYDGGTFTDPLTISEDEAIKLSYEALETLNIDGLSVENVYKSESDDYGGDTWFVDMVAVIDGIKIYDYQNTYSQDDEGEQSVYAPYMRPPVASFAVNDTGVYFMHIIDMFEITETINENVELMSVEDIKKRFSEQISYHHYAYEFSPQEINVHTMQLSYFISKVRDSEGEFMLIPVWDFLETHIAYEGDSQENSVLTLNAIDGSVINRDLGY